MICSNEEKMQSSGLGFMANLQPSHATAPETQSLSNNKGKVIGLYGIAGSGKTHLLKYLERKGGHKFYDLHEGSQVIDSIVPGGLKAFQKLQDQEKVQWRQRAIGKIGKQAADTGRVAVVTGHFMLWSEDQEAGKPVITQNDLDTFTHILYLDIPAEVVAQRLADDTERARPSLSVDHLDKWQQAEKTQLRGLCRQRGILFSLVPDHLLMPSRVWGLIADFRYHDENHNLSQAERKLDEAVAAGQGHLETVLVMDADKTLASEDTGAMFWKKIADMGRIKDREDPLKTLFSGPLGYSYTAFRQAMLLYEEIAEDPEFDGLCENIASAVTMHIEFLSLLRLVAEKQHVGAVIVTSGLRSIWERVLNKQGLSETVKVIGGGRIADGFVVPAAVKAAMVARLRNVHQVYVWAFGDSPLDLPMLREADQAVIVVGDEQTRSKSMEDCLTTAIDNGNLQARQAVLPTNAPPRLDTTKLPLIKVVEPKFLNSVLCRRPRRADLQLHSANHRGAAKVLMTPMRNAAVGGPSLRETHRRVGWYLAIEFLTDEIGLEEYNVPHVQGHLTSGHQISHEHQTLIVALMRGGEPLAFGVNDAFPEASFVHAKSTDDIGRHHLERQHTVILVDSVVNSGKTVMEFLRHIRDLQPAIRVVVVAGVTQTQSISTGDLAEELIRPAGTTLVTLRLSDNKYTGRGATDTGDRLFNTTHLA